MVWSDIYKTGIESIDNQHKELFGQINNYIDAVEKGKGRELAADMLRIVVAYTTTHFSDEEFIMAKAGYSECGHHHILHRNLVKHLRSILLDLKKTRVINLENLASFLSSWLTNHILSEDLKFAGFLERKGITK